jgi:hypothetical protein
MRSIHVALTTTRRLATIMTVASLAMVAASALLLVPNMATGALAPLGFFGVAGFVLGVTFPAVGWLIVSRSTAGLIGWLFLLMGLSQALDTLSQQYATYGLLAHPGALPLADVAAWIYSWAYVPGLLSFFPALLLFPDGRLPSRRWRPVLWAVAVAAVLILPGALIVAWPMRGVDLLPALVPLPPTTSAGTNPLQTLWDVGNDLVPLIVLATGFGVAVRFRRSEGIERLQLKWFAAAAIGTLALLMAFSLAALMSHGTGIPAPFDGIGALVEGALLPVAVGIAVLRYRLYEIDVVIRRTLVYVPLTALLAGLYAASIGISQRAFIAVMGKESDGAVIVSTLILAATFTPIKNAIQGRVDRSFRDPHDAERRLTAFTQSVSDQLATPDPARTMRAFLASAAGVVKAAGGEAWLETSAGELSVGATAARASGPRVEIPVEADGRRFGRLELDARLGGGAYGPRDLAALRLAAERLAVALGGFRASPVQPWVLASVPSPVVDSGE